MTTPEGLLTEAQALEAWKRLLADPEANVKRWLYSFSIRDREIIAIRDDGTIELGEGVTMQDAMILVFGKPDGGARERLVFEAYFQQGDVK